MPRKQKKTNTILAPTVYRALSVRPMTVKALRPIVQEAHPDICDDRVRLVYPYQDFGPKWWRSVRNALDHLQRNDLVERVGPGRRNGTWRVKPGSTYND